MTGSQLELARHGLAAREPAAPFGSTNSVVIVDFPEHTLELAA